MTGQVHETLQREDLTFTITGIRSQLARRKIAESAGWGCVEVLVPTLAGEHGAIEFAEPTASATTPCCS